MMYEPLYVVGFLTVSAKNIEMVCNLILNFGLHSSIQPIPAIQTILFDFSHSWTNKFNDL